MCRDKIRLQGNYAGVNGSKSQAQHEVHPKLVSAHLVLILSSIAFQINILSIQVFQHSSLYLHPAVLKIALHQGFAEAHLLFTGLSLLMAALFI